MLASHASAWHGPQAPCAGGIRRQGAAETLAETSEGLTQSSCACRRGMQGRRGMARHTPQNRLSRPCCTLRLQQGEQ